MSIMNCFPAGGGNISSFPEFTYTGSYSLIDDDDGNWRIKFLTSGTLTFTDKDRTIDLFLCGGGNYGTYQGGGGGGYTKTVLSIVLLKDVAYPIVVGAAGGGQSSAFAYIANGGLASKGSNGAAGGSGGGGRTGGIGGYNGSNGTAGSDGGEGAGQGTTTREFSEDTGDMYGTAGSGTGGATQSNGLTGPNSGRGSNGNNASSGAYSGIAIIRNHRAA